MTQLSDILSLTTEAKAHIKKMLSQKPQALGFRVAVKKTGCTGYMYLPEIVTQIPPEDLAFECDGFSIFIDKNALSMIQGTEIDYVTKSLGVSQLVFNNPNVKSLCGCGESFKVEENSHE